MIDLVTSFWNDTLNLYIGSLVVVGIIGLIQVGSLLSGISLIGWIDEIVPDTDAGDYLGWLGLGKVPLLVIIILFLSCFGFTGLVIHKVFYETFNFYLTNLIVSGVSLFSALILTRKVGNWIGKVIPKTTSTAVTTCSLIGKVATIDSGDACNNLAAEAHVKDDFGVRHNILVKPMKNSLIKQGSKVILIKQESNNTFLVDSEFSEFL